VKSYNEDDDLGLSDEDTENLTPNYWTYAEDTSPAIDQVLNHRLKEGAGSFRPSCCITSHPLITASRHI
jgi:chromodomain-helicase-DNA-binding protein 1